MDNEMLFLTTYSGIWRIDISEGKGIKLLEGSYRILNVDSSKQGKILAVNRSVAGRTRLMSINAESGEKSVVLGEEARNSAYRGEGYRGYYTDYHTDAEGRPCLRTYIKKSAIRMEYNPRNSEEWVPLQEKLNTDSDIQFDFDGAELLDRRFFPLFLDGDGLLYYATNAGSDRYEIWAYNVESEEDKGVVLEDPDFDIVSPLRTEDFEMVLDHDRQLSHIDYHADMPKRFWFRDQWKSTQARIDELLPYFFNTMTQIAANGSVVVVQSKSDIIEPFYSIYFSETDQLYSFENEFEVMKEYSLTRSRPFEFNSMDGKKIHGYLNLPLEDTQETEPLPCIVLIHGGPWTRDTWHMNRYARFYSSRGFAVARINYRGSVGFGREFLLSGVREYDGKMVEDLVSGVDYLVRRKLIDRKRIVLMGSSFGGYLSMIAAAQYPPFFKAIVSGFAPTDMRMDLKRKSRSSYFRGLSFAAYARTYFGHPSKDKEYLKQISPISYADSINCPVYLYNGELDYIVGKDHYIRMRKALRKAGVEFESTLYPEAGHGFYRWRDEVRNIEQVLQFLEKHVSPFPYGDN